MVGVDVSDGMLRRAQARCDGLGLSNVRLLNDCGRLADVTPNKTEARGKLLFRQTCASCHTLAAVNARGVTGPNLDQIGQVTKQRVLNAIRIGGTGDKRMPSGLLSGKNADAVATYVSKVAGQTNP